MMRLLLFAACDVAVWAIAGIFATSEFYRRSIVIGGGSDWNEVLDFQLVTALNWALFTPLIVLLAERLPLRPPHRARNLLFVIAIIPPLAVIRAAWGSIMVNYGEGEPISASLLALSLQIRTHRYIAILGAIFFICYLVQAQREAARRERQRVRAQTILARMELEELRSRLQPQFAVRMLRHIGGVLREDPRAAETLIVTLGGMLRRSMGRCNGERVPLADELEHLDRCLDLCRAGGRLAVHARYVADDDVLACRVPAHALQPAIESVVLDLTSGSGGSVEVRCKRESEDTHVDVCWNVAPDGAARSTTLRIRCEEGAAA
jgi:hypothetical protein